jgi:hypothetical protein
MVEETKTQETAAPSESVVKKDSVVDAVFDTLTAWTVHGLEAAQRGLEASARWLDGRAKVVEKLATKIGEKQTEPPAQTAQA